LSFLKDLETEYSGLPYYIKEVQWLSCSKVLKRFWKLIDVMKIILVSKAPNISLLSDPMWLQDIWPIKIKIKIYKEKFK